MENIGLFIKKQSEENNRIKLYTLLSVNCAWRFRHNGKILISSIHYYGDEFETEELRILQDIKKQNLSLIAIEEKKNKDYTIILSNDFSIDFFYIECLSSEKYAVNMKDEKGNIVFDIRDIMKILEL